MRSDNPLAMLSFEYFEMGGDRFDLLNDQATWLVTDDSNQVT